MTDSRSLSFARALILVFAPFAGGYFFSYLFRSVNAVVAPRLIDELQVNAEQLGLIAACYFFTFAICQVPLGVLLDRFGPRRVQGTLYILAAVGALLFSMADSVLTLALARALIGVGVSGGLMAALKAIVQWFPRERIALVNGWYLSSGGFGALFSTVPVEWGMSEIGWRSVFVVLAAGTLIAAVAILLVVPDKKEGIDSGGWADNIRGMGLVYRDPFFWRLVPLMFTSASANMAVQGLWAGPWLADVRGEDTASVANHLLVLAIGMVIGMFLSGIYADALRRWFRLTMQQICVVSGIIYTLCFAAITTTWFDASYLLWGLVGLTGIWTSLVFATLALHFPDTHIGRANTACNLFVFAMAFVYQYAIGVIVDQWPQAEDGSYPAAAYVTAFTIVAVSQAAAILWFFVLGWINPRSRGSE